MGKKRISALCEAQIKERKDNFHYGKSHVIR
jgi:hypothetical protein